MRKEQKWTLGVGGGVPNVHSITWKFGSANSGTPPRISGDRAVVVGCGLSQALQVLQRQDQVWKPLEGWKWGRGRVELPHSKGPSSSERLCPARRIVPRPLRAILFSRHLSNAAHLAIWGFFQSWLNLICKLVWGFYLCRAVHKRSLILCSVHSSTLSNT